ncbi:NAD(+) kinase [Francisellaceae bacterium]|nr:NAD(+) kinase [Francisellaceae bacterium]
MLQFKKIGLIGTHINPSVAETVCELYTFLKDKAEVFIESDTAHCMDDQNNSHEINLAAIAETCDVAIVVGGDGNFLNAGRRLSNYRDIPMIGINRGKLGFLTDIKPDEIQTRLLKVLEGEYRKESRFMIAAEVCCDQKGNQSHTEKTYAFNEIMVGSGQKSRLFEIDVEIDGRHAFGQRSDGIIVATPTGSTAHALSAGGPIMYPELNALSLVPMFSHSLNSRPVVINGDSVVEIKIGEYNNPEPVLSFDGHSHLTLKPGDKVKIQKHQKYVTVLHPLDYDYYKSLRTKLHWSKMLF